MFSKATLLTPPYLGNCDSSTTMKSTIQTPLIKFLQEELGIPTTSIALAMRHSEEYPSLLHMVLWQYGLVTLEQLEKIFDWLETA